MSYKFNPEDYGFLPPRKMPKQIKDRYGKTTYCKVICTTEDGSFWYHCCYQMPDQDRWKIMSGLYDANRPENAPEHDEYQKKREAWTALQPPMIEELPEEDAEDEVCQG